MKHILYSVFSVFMAFMLLASTVSWTVGKHYCMGRLINVSLFEHAEDCGMDMDAIDDYAVSAEKDSCCKDEIVVIEGQDDLKLSFEETAIDNHRILVADVFSQISSFHVFEASQVARNHYPPPIIVKDIQLLDEVFLI